MSEEAVSVFLSYSRSDLEMLNKLNKQLASLVRTHKIKTWHDRDIGAGSEWEPEIQNRLNTADIIILLISADFIASEYCYDNELKRAIERHNAGEARVIPVILKPCLWNLPQIPFSKLNVLPDHARPITKWEDPEEAFANVALHISNLVDGLRQRKIEQEIERQAEAAKLEQQPVQAQLPLPNILNRLLTHQPSVVPKKISSLKKLEPIHRPSIPSTASLAQNTCSLGSPILEIDSRTLQKNLAALHNQGTLEECREVITQTSQWLLQYPDESYVRNQLLKLVQFKATVEQQYQIIDQTTLWLSANLEASKSYTLTEYLKLVTSKGTPEQGQSAVSLTLKWLEKVQQNDSYVRRNCLILAKDKAIPETAQAFLNQTYSWLSENLEECDSYIMTAYLRLAIERGNIEQQQKAKEQAAIWLEKSDDPYVRTQYLKLLKIIE